MKTVIIYASLHHKNTEKIAKTMAAVLEAEAIDFVKADKERVVSADLVGFGSGIYFSKFHKGLLKFIEDLPDCKGKKAFIFSTAGMKANPLLNRGHKSTKKTLQKKNFQLVAEFECLGYDTNGPLKYFGGINKGRPNEKDIERAKTFAKNLCQI